MTDQLMDNLSNEEHEALLLMSEHGIAAPLSPAAKAVLDVAMQYEINPECYSREIVVAALRAAVDQVVPDQQEPASSPHMGNFITNVQWRQSQTIRTQLLAIATELEAQ